MRQISERKYIYDGTVYSSATINGVTYNEPRMISYDNTIVQGTAYDERIANKVIHTSLQLNISVYRDPTEDGVSSVLWRAVTFIWKDDTAPTFSDLFLDSPNTMASVDFFYNHTRKVKFKVISDEVWNQSAAAIGPTTNFQLDGVWGGATIMKRIRINLTKYGMLAQCTWRDASNTNNVNGIYTMIMNNLPGTGTTNNGWLISVGSKLGYVDY